jgi:hypothetical protein
MFFGQYSMYRATQKPLLTLAERRLIMSTCDICQADDVVAQRSSRGTDAQQRLVVHQQCTQGHRWHLAFNDATDPLGGRDVLACNCPDE